ncbi:MAG TPA: hypothetical protein VIF40_15835 [Methylosinus sp.]|jgi:hypothetical protein|uniref:hypothetical protein n=1 Tax=Methylosinus sp. TaxID=427 RepID=UPI002F953D0D
MIATWPVSDPIVAGTRRERAAMHDRRRDALRARLFVLRSDIRHESGQTLRERRGLAPHLIVVSRRSDEEEALSAPQRVAISIALALALLTGVSALSDAAANAMAAMEPRTVAALSERTRAHFGFGQ